jgi:hypothetical protein
MIHGIQEPADEARVRCSIYPFARMLAKIAYAAAVAGFGYEKTPKDLVPYILGNDSYISHVVGECPYPFPEHPQMITGEGGKLTVEPFRVSPGIWRGNGRQLLVTRVQLFRFLNTPTYWVVVGPADNYLIDCVEGQRE